MQEVWRRRLALVTRAPEKSMIGRRRRLVSDRAWFGLALIAAGLGSVGELDAWLKAISLGLFAIGVLLLWSARSRVRRGWFSYAPLDSESDDE